MDGLEHGHLVFAAGGEWYAVPAGSASAVVGVESFTPIPGAPPHVMGVFVHHGEVVPAIDLAALRGLAGMHVGRVLILRPPSGVFAVLVTKVLGLGEVPGRPQPLGGEGVLAHLRGPVELQGRQVTVIEPEGLHGFLASAEATAAA